MLYQQNGVAQWCDCQVRGLCILRSLHNCTKRTELGLSQMGKSLRSASVMGHLLNRNVAMLPLLDRPSNGKVR